MQDVDGVLGDAQQEPLAGGVDNDHGGLLADALAADHGQCAVSPPPAGALAEPALQEPHEAQHRAQGHEYPQPEDQRVHSVEPLGDVQDAGDPDGVVLVQDHDFAVRDQPAVEQDVSGGTGGPVQFDDLARFQGQSTSRTDIRVRPISTVRAISMLLIRPSRPATASSPAEEFPAVRDRRRVRGGGRRTRPRG